MNKWAASYCIALNNSQSFHYLGVSVDTGIPISINAGIAINENILNNELFILLSSIFFEIVNV